jgi:cellulose synthase/poly-beta-1,6-N-acetylglucosamine synthase-like glycosyltransferase
MLIAICLIFIVYLYFVFWILSGIKKSHNFSFNKTDSNFHPFSIIIAAHNEESVIQDTLDDLVHQDYPVDNIQVIVVLDRCTDSTGEIVHKMSKLHQNIESIEIDHVVEGLSPKKNALQKGIQKARYDYLILMDADCRTRPEYLNTINAYFLAGVEVLLNIPKFSPAKHFMYKYLLPERLITWGIGVAGIGHKKPFLAFGTTWSYSKKLYEQVGGFDKFSESLSGDDDLLIYQMGKLNPVMAVCLNPKGWGVTRIPATLHDFFIQRRRHHSAGKLYAPEVKTGYAVFHLANLSLWILPIFYPPVIIALLAKFLMDSIVLHRTAGLFQEKVSPLNFIVFEFGYLLHHVFIAPMGFFGKIKWR